MPSSVHSLNNLIREIGEVGLQMTEIGVVEGSAGNISVFVRELDGVDWRFRSWGLLPLPVPVPALTGGWVLVSATGKRLRDIARSPETTLCLLNIHPDGKHALSARRHGHAPQHRTQLPPGDPQRLCRAARAEPPRHPAHPAAILTYLSHHPDYNTTEKLSQRRCAGSRRRFDQFPNGIGTIPFEIPGSPELMRATLASLQKYRLVVWQKHGSVSAPPTTTSTPPATWSNTPKALPNTNTSTYKPVNPTAA